MKIALFSFIRLSKHFMATRIENHISELRIRCIEFFTVPPAVKINHTRYKKLF